MSFTPYSPTGPFTNGGAPGISAAFLNEEERILKLINALACDANVSSDLAGNASLASLLLTGNVQTINGTSGGTVTLYQPMTGSGLKIVIASFNNYNNTTTTRQQFTFTNAFTSGAFYWVGAVTNPNTSGIYFRNGSTLIATNNCCFSSGSGVTRNIGTTNRNPCFSIGEVGNPTLFEVDGSLSGASIGEVIIIGA